MIGLISTGFIPETLLRYISKVNGLSKEMMKIHHGSYSSSVEMINELLDVYIESEERRSKISDWLNFSLERYFLIDRYVQDRCIILNEKLVNYSVSIFAPPYPKKELDERDVKKYCRAIPVLDQIIFLSASPEECISRMKGRRSGYPDDYEMFSDEEMKEVIKRQLRCFEIMICELKDKGVEVVEIDAENNLNQLINRVESELNLASVMKKNFE